MTQTRNPSSDWYTDPDTVLAELRRGSHRPSGPPNIEGYDEVTEIRRGGQGIVYRAIQRSTRRKVAIKVLHEESVPSLSRRRRFEREIELVATLEHPNIVRVYDSGVTADDRAYFVMEYIEGMALDEWLHERVRRSATEPLTVREFVPLFAKVCRAVGFAHLHGVIHRDLKPSNIRMDAFDEPRVLDFGVAKALATVGSVVNATMTLESHFLGTLAYASPEQLTEETAVDVRTDVFSLGVILYEIITGRQPFPHRGSLERIIKGVTKTDPLPPGRAAAEGCSSPFAGGIDYELDAIVLKALAKEPQRRYATADALAIDLERYVAGEPIEAKRDSASYVLRKYLRRYRVQAVAGVMFLVLVMTFAVAMSVLYRRSAIEAAKANQIKTFLEDTLGSVEGTDGGHEITVREVLDEAVQWVEVALADQPEVAASLRTTIGNSYRNLGRFQEAGHQLELALQTYQQLFGPEHPSIASSLNALGLLRRSEGRIPEAETLLRRGLEMRRRMLGAQDSAVAISEQNLAAVLHTEGRDAEAERLFRDSLALRETILGQSHPDVAMSRFVLAEFLRDTGRLDEAEQLHRRALAARLEVLHPEHPDVARSRTALAGVLLDAGNPSEAEPLLRECLKAQAEALPSDNPRIAVTESLLGRCLAEMERFSEAEPLLLHAYRVLKHSRGAGHRDTASLRNQLITMYESWGRGDKARAIADEAP